MTGWPIATLLSSSVILYIGSVGHLTWGEIVRLVVATAGLALLRPWRQSWVASETTSALWGRVIIGLSMACIISQFDSAVVSVLSVPSWRSWVSTILLLAAAVTAMLAARQGSSHLLPSSLDIVAVAAAAFFALVPGVRFLAGDLEAIHALWFVTKVAGYLSIYIAATRWFGHTSVSVASTRMVTMAVLSVLVFNSVSASLDLGNSIATFSRAAEAFEDNRFEASADLYLSGQKQRRQLGLPEEEHSRYFQLAERLAAAGDLSRAIAVRRFGLNNSSSEDDPERGLAFVRLGTWLVDVGDCVGGRAAFESAVDQMGYAEVLQAYSDVMQVSDVCNDAPSFVRYNFDKGIPPLTHWNGTARRKSFSWKHVPAEGLQGSGAGSFEVAYHDRGKGWDYWRMRFPTSVMGPFGVRLYVRSKTGKPIPMALVLGVTYAGVAGVIRSPSVSVEAEWVALEIANVLEAARQTGRFISKESTPLRIAFAGIDTYGIDGHTLLDQFEMFFENGDSKGTSELSDRR